MLSDGGRCTKGYHINGTSKGKSTNGDKNNKSPGGNLSKDKDTQFLSSVRTETAMNVQHQVELQAQSLSFLEVGMRQMFTKILTDMRPVLEHLRSGMADGQKQIIPQGMVSSTPCQALAQTDPLELFYQNLPVLLKA